MPKPTTFRRMIDGVKVTKNLSDMPSSFQAVVNAWDLTKESTIMAVAAHPYTESEPWHYTLTFEMKVNGYNLRGHVHYKANSGSSGFTPGPGYFWVSGIKGCEGKTPSELVTRYEAVDVIAEALKSAHG